MLFNSLAFFIFLAVVLVMSAVLRKYSRKAELWFLVLASAYFYGQWSWKYLLLIYTTICVDYLLGLRYHNSERPHKYLLISLWVNLGILGLFKYFNFLLDSTNQLLVYSGFDYHFSSLELLLPVGISFYTFQSMSYMIDIHRKSLKPRTQFVDYALFVSFFPQLVAGPIVRASEFFKQLDEKRHFDFSMAQAGVMLIMVGLVKKVVFADNLALFVDPVFNQPEAYSGLLTLLAVYGFAFQIYFDFSGYTDIAIGVAKLLGFNFPRNFMHPYVSLSIQDFWRRWHMTLSRWLRDYLYISLGGNREGTYKTTRNLFLTMFLGGLWHGASWNFAIWGVLHGVYLGVERINSHWRIIKLNDSLLWVKLVLWFWVFHLVCFAWVFFRAGDLSDSTTVIQNILWWKSGGHLSLSQWYFAIFIAMCPVLHWLSARYDITSKAEVMGTKSYVLIQTLLILTLMVFSTQQSESFMYFQF